MTKRVISLILSIVMVLTLMPMRMIASAEEYETDVVEEVGNSDVSLYARFAEGEGFSEYTELIPNSSIEFVFCFGTEEDYVYVSDLEFTGVAMCYEQYLTHYGATAYAVGVNGLGEGAIKYTHTDGKEYSYPVDGILGYAGDIIAIATDPGYGWEGYLAYPSLTLDETVEVEFAVLDSKTTYQKLPENTVCTTEGVAILEHVEGTVYKISVSDVGNGQIHCSWGDQTGILYLWGYDIGTGPDVDDSVVRLFACGVNGGGFIEDLEAPLNCGYPLVFCFGTYADHIYVTDLETEGVAYLSGQYTDDYGAPCFELGPTGLGEGAVKYTHTDGIEYTFAMEGILGWPGTLICVFADSSLGYDGVELSPALTTGQFLEVEFAALDSKTTYQMLPEDTVFTTEGVATLEHVEGTVYKIGVSGAGEGHIHYTYGEQSGSMFLWGFQAENPPEDEFGQEEFDAVLDYVDGCWWLMEDIDINGKVDFDDGNLLLLAHNAPGGKNITIAQGGVLSIGGGSSLPVQYGGSITVENGGMLRITDSSFLSILNDGSLTVHEGGIVFVYNSDVYVNASGTITVADGAILNVDHVIVNPGSTVNGVDFAMLRMADVAVDSVAELKTAMAQYAEYEGLEVYTSEGFTITENLTIPFDMVFVVGGGATVTVAAGVTLTNHGVLFIDSEAELIHNGTMVGIGLLEIEEGGTFTNYGTVNLDPDGILAEGTCGANATWTITGDGVLTISGTGAMDGYSAGGGIASPWSPYRNYVTSVVVEDGITDLGYAPFFDMVALTTVTLPEGISTIPGFCFSRCSELVSVNMPASVIRIESTAFALCEELFNLTFLSDAPEFAENAFNLYTGNVYYPKDNATWTNDVFQAYGGMITWIKEGESTGITVGGNSGGGGIPDWEVGSGQWGPNATYVLDENGVLTISGTGTIGRNGDLGNNIKTIVIEDGITGIGDFAFGSSFGLTSVVIPDSVNALGDNIFCYCYSLTDVTLPAGITTIPVGMFQECTSLLSIEIPATVTSISDRAFRASGLESFEMPESVTSIGSEAFCVCTALESITLPESLTEMGTAAFAGCSALSEIIFCGNAPAIADNAFDDVTATVSYPETESWTEDVLQSYGGTIDWVSYPTVPDTESVKTVQELQDALEARIKNITIAADMVLNSHVDLVNTTVEVDSGVTLTVKSSMYINPESVLSVEGKLVSNGEINVEGVLITSGEVVNNGTMWANNGGKINIQNSASLVNNLQIHVGFGDEDKTFTSMLQVYGTLTNYGYLNVVAKGKVQAMGIVNNAEADDKIGFVELHGNMTVNGTMNNASDVGIAAYGILRVTGTYTGEGVVQMYCEYGERNVDGIPYDSIVANYVNVVDAGTLVSAIADKTYKTVNVTITGNIVLNDSLLIPAGSTLYIAAVRTDTAAYARNIATRSTCASLTVPEGKTLTIEGGLSNEGNVIIAQNAELVNKEDAIIENTGSLMVEESASMVNEGKLANEGTVTVAPKAALTNNGIISVENNGEVIIQNQGAIVNNGDVTVQNGEVTVEEGGTLEGNLPYEPVAMIKEKPYASLTDALEAAETGDKICLVKDAEQWDVIVKEGITLDLNGHALTAEYVFAVKGSNIVDNSADNTGILLVNPDQMMVSSTNSDLPVWTGEGFIFIDVLKFQEMYRTTAQGQKQYIFSPTFETIAHQYLMQGMENSRVKIAIRMTWEIDTGSAFQNFVFNDKTVKDIIGSFNGKNYTQAFYATITNSEYADFALQVVLISDTGVELACN